MSTSTASAAVPELRVVGGRRGRAGGAPPTGLAVVPASTEPDGRDGLGVVPASAGAGRDALVASAGAGRDALVASAGAGRDGLAASAGAGRDGLAAAAGLAGLAAPRVVPVPEALAGLFPWRGMRVGSVVTVQGSPSLLFALLSVASAAGAWVAVVGRDDLGLLAAAEAGVEVRRLALVPRPGAELAAVANALLDGMELVALAGVERLTAADVRRLTGRARQRGAVLLPLGDWPGADVRLRCERIEWSGLGDGHGRLRSMRMTVLAEGRAASARPRTAVVDLVDGRLVEPVAESRWDGRGRRIEAVG